MKTKIFSLSVAILFATSSFSQIKIFSGGTTSYGATSAPYSGEKHHFSGDVMISSVPTISNSCILLRGAANWSGNTTPDYSWAADNQTGLFHPASGIIGLTISGTEKMRLRSDGLAIGTIGTSSDARLAVYGAQNKYTMQTWSNFTWDGGTSTEIIVNRNATHAFRIFSTASGNTLTYQVDGSGDVWGKTWTGWSDKNLKENFDSIPNALEKVRQLKGWCYNFKTMYCKSSVPRKEMGLIAQDVEKIIPEVVNTNENGMKGIIYDDLIALLVEAIKEQDKQISKLQSDVNSCCDKTNSNSLNSNNTDLKNAGINSTMETKTISYVKQNSPNPFNKESSIGYFIAEKNADASILVFDMNGKLLKTFKLTSSGESTLIISANDFKPGMYYYSLIINNKEIDTKKMILTE